MGSLLNNYYNNRIMSIQQNQSNIIYELYNHQCDGTSGTCIDTGIKLLSPDFRNRFEAIKIELKFLPTEKNLVKAHVIRCNSATPHYPGFYIRYYSTSEHKYLIKYTASSNEFADYITYTPGTPLDFTIIFDFLNSEYTMMYNIEGGESYVKTYKITYYDSIFDVIPFTIGGSLANNTDASGGWKEMWIGTIDKLIIKQI